MLYSFNSAGSLCMTFHFSAWSFEMTGWVFFSLFENGFMKSLRHVLVFSLQLALSRQNSKKPNSIWSLIRSPSPQKK